MPKRPQVASVSVRKLKPNKRNDRSHSKQQIKRRSDTILQLGFNSPTIIDENLRIFEGQSRREVIEALISGLVRSKSAP